MEHGLVLQAMELPRGHVAVFFIVTERLALLDGDEADDKIVAVLENDNFWGEDREIEDLPELLIERLNHYFLTYKLIHGTAPSATIESVFGASHAHEIIQASLDDYVEEYGE